MGEPVIISNRVVRVVVRVGVTKERFEEKSGEVGSLPNMHLGKEPSRQRKELEQRTQGRSQDPT